MAGQAWQKASRCTAGECVEVKFAKSERSNPSGNCVEVGRCGCDMVHVRDSKDKDGPRLAFTRAEWDVFVAGVKDGEFDG